MMKEHDYSKKVKFDNAKISQNIQNIRLKATDRYPSSRRSKKDNSFSMDQQSDKQTLERNSSYQEGYLTSNMT